MRRTRKQSTLADVGEHGFLARLLPRIPSGSGVFLGPGDDTAVVAADEKQLLLTTDTLVEGVHFRRDWMSARQIGRKAYLVNASDIAAMGGRPRFAVVSVGAPPDFPVRELSEIHRGMVAAAGETGAVVVGGNLSRAGQLFLSVTLVGETERAVARSGGRPGDQLFVTGSLGDAALGLRSLLRSRRVGGSSVARFREPVPRLEAGSVLARGGVVSAMIDVSDGLVQDLGHICDASGVGAEIEVDRLPRSARVRAEEPALALTGGEDYELLFAVPARHRARLRRLIPRLGCPLSQIGRLLPKKQGVRVLDEQGELIGLSGSGFDHFG